MVPGGVGIPACTEADPPPEREKATAADDTHPTGMHSCFVTFVSVSLLKAIINCTYGSFNSLINICDHHRYKLKSTRNSKIMKI